MLAGLACVCLSLVAPAASFAHVPAGVLGDTAAATQLVDRYAPDMDFRPQPKLCGPGEPFRPTTVDILLGNSQVVLRNSKGKIIKRGPTAGELATAAAGDHVDLQGNALSPGCFYQKQFKRWFGRRQPTVYAHLATDSEHPGKLAVQYWSFYIYNDFTNKHEGDWEMAQVDFDAATPEEALEKGPYQVDYAQHAGGERGSWTHDPKLTKEGTHPVEHVVSGAHAGYFQEGLYLGKGGSTVFGCEDTRKSTEQVQVQPILVPNTPVPVDSRFAWLDYQGRWGQQHHGINNGVRGPVQSLQWKHPIAWSDGLRAKSLKVPGGRALGLSATGFFCGAVDQAAIAMNWALIHPDWFIALCALVLAAIVAGAWWTRWRPLDQWPIRRSRRGGQILRTAGRVYVGHPLTFIGIGALFVPVSLLTAGIQWILFRLPFISGLVGLDGRAGAGTVVLALFVGDIGAAFAAAAVTGAVAAALNELDRGRPVSTTRAYALAGRNASGLGGATLIQFVILAILILTVIGIPFAVYYFIRTSFFVQECVLRDATSTGALSASSQLVRGSFFRTLGFTVFVSAIAYLAGPLVGVLILLLTDRSLNFIDLTGAVVYALVVPYAAAALTLYYFDLNERRRERAAPVQRVEPSF